MRCQKCGKKLKQNETFCTVCGSMYCVSGTEGARVSCLYIIVVRGCEFIVSAGFLLKQPSRVAVAQSTVSKAKNLFIYNTFL